MSSNDNIAVIIPARLGSQRLPGKPLADIAGVPMIVRAATCATQAAIGEVHIACAEQQLVSLLQGLGFSAILTDPTLPSGTDRVFAAWKVLEQRGKQYKYVVNLQGDMPLFPPEIITMPLEVMVKYSPAIATCVSTITTPARALLPQVVKVAMGCKHRALYFSRSPIPYGKGELYEHVGVYVYQPQSLQQFVGYQASSLEQREGLEQLRALENGMAIRAAYLPTEAPLAVDTPQDLAQAQAKASELAATG